MNIDDNSSDMSPDTFKKPIPPSGTPRGRKKQLKTFTLEELTDLILKSELNIVIDKIETDFENSPNDLNGPWYYNNVCKSFIHYRILQSDMAEPQKIQLKHLRLPRDVEMLMIFEDEFGSGNDWIHHHCLLD